MNILFKNKYIYLFILLVALPAVSPAQDQLIKSLEDSLTMLGKKYASVGTVKIKKITQPTKLEVFVSLSCHFCPAVVSAGQQIASLQPLVETEMIDISLFPELKQKLKIMSVPALSINGGKIVFGAKKIDEIVDQILQEA